MATGIDRATEITEYAAEHGDRAACEKYNLKLASLERYRALKKDTTSDYLEYSDILKKSPPTRYTDYPKVYGDFMVTMDWHLPFINIALLNTVVQVAEILKIRQLGILGDFVDCESISRFDFGGDQYELFQELKIGREFLRTLSKKFDRIVIIRGNHDERIIRLLKHIRRAMKKDPRLAAYHAIFTGGEDKDVWQEYRDFFTSQKVEMSDYPMMEFEGKYLGVHPSSYSRNAGNIEVELCHKYRKHIIGAHGHLTGLRFDKSGKSIGLQLGGLPDDELLFYKGMGVTTHPAPNPAFGWIKGGKLGYYIDHPDLMNIFDYMEFANAPG